MKLIIFVITIAILCGCTKSLTQTKSNLNAPISKKIAIGMNISAAVTLLTESKWEAATIPYKPVSHLHSYKAYSNIKNELLILLYEKNKVIEKIEYQKSATATTEEITEYAIQK